MKTTKTLLAAVVFSAGLLSATGANAALTSALGGQVVNDTDLNLTWLANANLAASNTFGVSGILADGRMNWNTAQSWYSAWTTAQQWIGAMNAANYLGFNDWRLPTTLQDDATCSIDSFWGASPYGLNCTGSEMGHLFYNELGGVAGQSITTTHNANYGLFQNVRPYYYWFGTMDLRHYMNAWYFDMNNGFKGWSYTTVGAYMNVMAVRSGQVAAVPEPETYAMLLAGLGLLGFTARRRKDLTA